jgi:hypothetical protein
MQLTEMVNQYAKLVLDFDNYDNLCATFPAFTNAKKPKPTPPQPVQAPNPYAFPFFERNYIPSHPSTVSMDMKVLYREKSRGLAPLPKMGKAEIQKLDFSIVQYSEVLKVKQKEQVTLVMTDLPVFWYVKNEEGQCGLVRAKCFASVVAPALGPPRAPVLETI